VVVPIGSNIEPDLPADFDRRAWRAAQGVASGELVLAYFGFLGPTKGADVLLAAFDRLPEDCRARLWLLTDREPTRPEFAGYHARIAERVESSPRRDRIHWTGYLPATDVSRFLSAADLAVLPYTDGASLRRSSLIVALAHGLPVLSTGDQAPLPGVEVMGGSDPDRLAAALARFCHHPERLASLSRDARRALPDRSWASIAGRTLDVLDAVPPRAEGTGGHVGHRVGPRRRPPA
jgi:glycosyltransferase involved in cell wall biosynthesis